MNRDAIDLATRVTVDDGGLLDREHIEIVSLLQIDTSSVWREISRIDKALRLCKRPASIKRVDR